MFPPKSDFSEKTDFKMWHDEEFSNQNITFCETFNSKPEEKNFTSVCDTLWNFRFKVWFYFVFHVLAQKWLTEKEFDEFETWLCLIIGAACWFVGFSIIVGNFMALIAILFALSLHFFKVLWVAKYGKLIRIWFQLLNCYYNCLNHLGNCLHFLLLPVHNSSI